MDPRPDPSTHPDPDPDTHPDSDLGTDPVGEAAPVLLLMPSSSALAALPGRPRVASPEELRGRLDAGEDVRTVVVGPSVELGTVADLVAGYRLSRPEVGFVLERFYSRGADRSAALDAGVRDVVTVGDLGSLSAAVSRPDPQAPVAARGPLRPAPAAGRSPDHQQARRVHGRLVTVHSAKGGCGVTTLAANWAAALAARSGRSVVLVDLDLRQGDVAVALDLPPSGGLPELASAAVGDLDFPRLHALLTRHRSGLYALLAPADPAGAATVPPAVVRQVLQVLREHVDHVVVDTPTTAGAHVLAALQASDTVVLTATPDLASLRHLGTTVATLRRLGVPQERWRVVLNRVEPEAGLDVREVERALGCRVAGTLPSSPDVARSSNRGTPLVLEQPWHPFSQAVRELAGHDRPGRRAPGEVDLRDGRTARRGPVSVRVGADAPDVLGRLRRAAPH